MKPANTPAAGAADLNFLAGCALPGTKPGAVRVHTTAEPDEQSVPLKAALRHQPKKENDMAGKKSGDAIAEVKRVLDAMGSGPVNNIKSKCTGVDIAHVRAALKSLRADGLAHMTGAGPGSVWHSGPASSESKAPAGKAKRGTGKQKKVAPKLKKARKARELQPPPTPAMPSIAPTVAADFTPAIAGDGSLLLFEGSIVDTKPIVLRPSSTRVLVAFLRTLPANHELAL